MDIKIIYASVGLISAGVGFFIGLTISKKKFNKKVDEIYGETSQELSEMKKELDEYHRIFVSSGDIETQTEREKFWKSVSDKIKMGRKAVADSSEKQDILPKEDEVVELSVHRDKDTQTDYHAILSGYMSKETEESKQMNSVVRTSADNGIFEIFEWEAKEDTREFPVEDLYYNEMTTDVYRDDETMIDPMDIPLYVGYTQEELAIRFLHTDEPSYIYVRNPEHERIYCVYVTQQIH